MRVIFMGTPDFAVPCLRALTEAGHEICAVYTQPARPAGRGKNLRPAPIQQFAKSLNLPIETPESLKTPAEQAVFKSYQADIAVVVAYGLILPPEILCLPTYGCWNLHGSLLPRWRGAAPIQRAIMTGDTQSGVCVMRMEQGLDTGPILLREITQLTPEDTAQKLHDRLAHMGAPLMVDALARLEAGNIRLQEQSSKGITYAAKIQKQETRIDWTRPASELDCHIRGLSPFPGAWFLLGEERIKIRHCVPEYGPITRPGTLVDDNLLVACGQGALRLLEVQRAGKAPMTAADFLRGFPLKAGQILI